jgi:hypothetical protein
LDNGEITKQKVTIPFGTSVADKANSIFQTIKHNAETWGAPAPVEILKIV